MATQTLTPLKRTIVGVQFMFVAFGSTVLVPLLVGFDPAIALLAAGLGTLLFHGVTKGKVPIFLGSSFAFIAPIVKATELYGMPGMFCGLVAVGVVYLLMSLLVKLFGISFIKKLFPPIVIGPVIILIGLSLAGTGVNMASQNWVLAIISLLVAIACSIWGKGLVKIIPVFFGAIAGYIAAVIFFRSGMDFGPVAEAKWFALPHFAKMSFSWQAIVFMAPVAIAPIIEHVGDVYAISEIAGKDFIKDPGLHRTMAGDGLACMLAAFLGGAPVTTYSEVTGAVSLTKVTDPSCMRIAAITALLVSLIGKVGAAIQTIPTAVLGGIMLLLFGSIAAVGINNLVKAKVDMNKTRNLIIASLILTIGIGGAIISFGKFSLAGIGLASIVGVILNLIIPDKKDPEPAAEEAKTAE
ncbi:MAG: uracil permease [Bacteroidales bacterium]|nr:uracil permease [Bacteroidales bacterium]